ncbi:MAG: hypothetical protein U0326_41790 [Polyangiales bacterium]
MKTLTDNDRRTLQRTVETARTAAEAGAREALVQLTVGEAKPGAHLDDTQKALRNRLHAHARQLGDKQRDDKTHPIERLVGECAYAHWHRMLFARFLAENSLLLHPEGYPVSLDELAEWATEWGLRSRWEAAEKCAAPMLPQIFGASALVLSVDLSRAWQATLEGLLEALPVTVFKARDALGWVYQFWQSAEKERVNKSEKKIGADELPAVTQLFTEPYMVDFLLQNTLGAWWVGRHGKADLPVEMPYLRFLDDGTPASGTFDAWPKTAKELKVLDPCCGSGHFLVAALDLLVRFRMKEEGLLPRVAAELVIQDNLHGLELDPRCTQIAAFAVSFAAWTFPRVERWSQLPELHIACVGLGIHSKLGDWLALANGNTKFRAGMERLYAQFANAPVLGSLIDPTATRDTLLEASFEELQPLLKNALASERWAGSDEGTELGSVAQGIAKAASLLAGKYTLVCTNPPYLLRRKQDPYLLEFLKTYHGDTINDLGIAFVDRIQGLLTEGGVSAVVVPQSFIELRSYQVFRRQLLDSHEWRFLARIGAGGFRTISGEVVNVCAAVLESATPTPSHVIYSIDVSFEVGADSKDQALLKVEIEATRQADVRSSPEARFSTLAADQTRLLGDFASASWGVSPADLPRFGRSFWELNFVQKPWVRWQSSFSVTSPYTGRELVLNMGDELHAEVEAGKALLRGVEYWGRPSVVVTVMGGIPCTIGTGEPVDTNVATVVPSDESHLPALWAYCESGEFSRNVRKLYNGLKVTSGTLPQVPFDLAHWQKVADEKYPDGLPRPHSDDPTQWLFKGDVPSSTRPLQVAVARLVGYRWPDQPEDPVLDALVDNDGLVGIPAIRQEKPAADRLLNLLVAAYGARWTTSTLDELLTREGAAGATLEGWLRDRFFAAHCQLFENRPFVWQVWDGLPGGFSVLIHYHRFTKQALETLIDVDLGDWIFRQETAASSKVDGAELRLTAARALQTKLQTILKGESPYDIFVRWKPLESQPLGWEPDLDDGVRLNIRPFVQAGILRTPSKNLKGIDWKKDRGKDPTTAPWFKRFQGERINDHHTTLDEKKKAREAKARGGQ